LPITSEPRRMSGIDDLLSATALLPRPGWVTELSRYRSWGDAPFADRDRAVVRLFIVELLRAAEAG
jgi:hypothetical protein